MPIPLDRTILSVLVVSASVAIGGFYLWNQQKKKKITLKPGYWFDDIQQVITSSATNTIDEDWEKFDPNALTSYASPNFHDIELPKIYDNTEGIGGVHDLWVPPHSKLWIDIGGGKSNSSKLWLENKYPFLKVFVVDPFQRSRKENEYVQDIIQNIGGADIASSISVLNVIDSYESRIKHILVVYDALKPGGIAYFKAWAGSWPARGTGIPFHDKARNAYQANVWASGYLDEISEVFGEGYVMADNNRNLLIAKKRL